MSEKYAKSSILDRIARVVCVLDLQNRSLEAIGTWQDQKRESMLSLKADMANKFSGDNLLKDMDNLIDE